MNIKPKTIILILIISLGFILRIWGIDFGLPYQFHQDEPIVVNHSLAYGSGDFNPRFFNIPPFTSYILFFFYGLYFLIGKGLGHFTNATEFALSFFKDPSIFYIIGRLFIGVIPGSLCIIFTYLLAKRLFSKNCALFASFIMAIAFLNVINSHYIYTDTLLVMFTLLTYINILRMLDEPSQKKYIISAISLGLAVGTKYNAALLGLPFFLTHLLVGDNKKIISLRLWLSFLTTIAVFIIVNPFALLSFREFQNSLRSQGAWYTGWTHHLLYSLKQGISTPILICGIIGLFVMPKGKKGVIFISFPVFFYAVLVFYSQHFSRYALPLTPFISIGAGYFIFDFVFERIRSKPLRTVLVLAALLLTIPTIIKTVKADMLFSDGDTRIISARWIEDNLPQGAKIAFDDTFFRPALKKPFRQLKRDYEFIQKQPHMADLKEKKLELMLMASDKNYRGYELYFLYPNPETAGKFLSMIPALPFDIERLRKEGIGYVVINYIVYDNNFNEQLKKEAVLISQFSPYKDSAIRIDSDKVETTCIPIKTEELFARKCMGPALEIYSLKEKE